MPVFPSDSVTQDQGVPGTEPKRPVLSYTQENKDAALQEFSSPVILVGPTHTPLTTEMSTPDAGSHLLSTQSEAALCLLL